MRVLIIMGVAVITIMSLVSFLIWAPRLLESFLQYKIIDEDKNEMTVKTNNFPWIFKSKPTKFKFYGPYCLWISENGKVLDNHKLSDAKRKFQAQKQTIEAKEKLWNQQ